MHQDSVMKDSFNFFHSVDSLLQIHAMHNLLQIDETIDTAQRQSYEADMSKLELKYLEKYVNLVQLHLHEQTKWDEKIEAIRSKFIANEYQWWVDALKNECRDSEQLLRRIQGDIKTSYDKRNDGSNSLIEMTLSRFQTIDGLLLVLTLWMDKVIEERENVQQVFKELQFFIDNFKPITEIDASHRQRVQSFLNSAYECHLRPKKDNEQEAMVFIIMDRISPPFPNSHYPRQMCSLILIRKRRKSAKNLNHASCAKPKNIFELTKV